MTQDSSNCEILNPIPSGKIEDSFHLLRNEAQDLLVNLEVPAIEKVASPLEFFREWVAPNRPVIIHDACRDWPALKKWSFKYLRDKIGETEITVAVTPNGYADAPNGGFFVTPEERTLKFKEFLDILENPGEHNGIFYIQKQNSNFTEELDSILPDVLPEIPWFSTAIGKQPDAINFWMGDQRAVTSMHKDHYENIYCVIRGYKDFILIPPTDTPWVPYKRYPAAQYKEIDGQFYIQPSSNLDHVPWICIDPLKPDVVSFPGYQNTSPVTCRVNEGDALYLPSLWFHHVQQSHGCIAVNYWYDMEYDIKYCYYKFMQALSWNHLPE